MLAALQLAAPALAAAWAWLLATLSSLFWAAFWALRLGIYAVLVWTAWESIIEERGAPHARKQHKVKTRHSGSGSPKLSAEVLREHDAAAPAAAAPGGSTNRAHRRRLPHSPSTLSSSDSLDSIEEWSIWDAESEASSEESAEEVAVVDAPRTPAAARAAPAAAPLPAQPASAAVRTAPVTVQPVPTPSGQQTSVADQVLPDELAAVAADQDEKEALASATLASGTAAATAATSDAAAEVSAARRHKHGKKAKKPWLNRKIEAMIKPYTSKYTGVGVMIYKGFSRMGQRMERSSAVLGKQLNSAIRRSGAEAVAEAEGLLKKWFKFFGVLIFLTIALMPLPSVHVTLVAGG